MNYSRFSSAFITILVILSVVSLKMAFLYGSDLIVFLVVTIPLIIAIVAFRNINKTILMIRRISAGANKKH